MTEIAPMDPQPEKKCCRKKKLLCLLSVILLVAAISVALASCPWFIRMHSGNTPGDLAAIQQRVLALEMQMSEVTNVVANRNAPPAPGGTPASAAPPGDLQHMQSDIAALTSTLTALQAEVKQTGSHAAESQQATQATLATAIAFIQLREAAASGRVFSNELATMRDASKNDAVFQEQLGKLEPVAAKGAPTISALHDELLNNERDAALAIDKANAQNWWERILAEIKTLVSVRKQHGAGATDAFADMETALAKGDVTTALSSLQNMPPEAEQSLGDWKAKAEARQTVDTALREMAARFTALAAPPAPPAQGAP